MHVLHVLSSLSHLRPSSFVPSSSLHVVTESDVADSPEEFDFGLDVEAELLLENDDNPGTTRGTKLSIVQVIVFTFLVNRACHRFFHSCEHPCSEQSLPSDRTAGVSSSNCRVTSRSRSWTKSCASSFVCTSPFAVTTVVGVLDLHKVSISSELESFFAQREHWSSRINHKHTLFCVLGD